ncbi:MAG TPA: c-type cytochrome [Candidatus Saccharimonadales bacterium]|nr:c-type cytochrome [Candidatus Saccharimonadales bacterium]
MKRILRIRPFPLFLLSVAAPSLLWASTLWINKVPAREHERVNPIVDSAEAKAAGQLLYDDHCAKCHGDDAAGRGKRPSLLTDRVQNDATAGDLHWLLVNGSLRKGMPSWSRLPDQQLWQIVSYVKSLKR